MTFDTYFDTYTAVTLRQHVHRGDTYTAATRTPWRHVHRRRTRRTPRRRTRRTPRRRSPLRRIPLRRAATFTSSLVAKERKEGGKREKERSNKQTNTKQTNKPNKQNTNKNTNKTNKQTNKTTNKTTPKPPKTTQNHPKPPKTFAAAVMCRPVSKFTHTLTKLTDYFLILFLVRDETDFVMQ